MPDISSSPTHKIDAASREGQSSDPRPPKPVTRLKAAAPTAVAVPPIDPLDSEKDEQHRLDVHA